jgi:hypothetical protein
MKLMHIWTIQLSIEVHSEIVIVLLQHYNIIKGLKNISFNENLSTIVSTFKESIIMNNFLK